MKRLMFTQIARMARVAVAPVLCAALASGALAQSYPAKPVMLVVPYGPGGGVDIVARAIQGTMGKSLGQPIVVENRAGAGGTIGAAYVARSAPDGYTLFLTDVGPSAVYPSIKPDLPYKVGKDLIPVGMVASSSLNLAINPALKVNSVAEFVAYAKAHPGTINYSSPGNGTIVHMAGELFKMMTQTDMVHVPYKSGAEAVTALLGGQVQASFAQIPLSVPLAAGGKIKILGVSSEERSPLVPAVPTISEAGLKGYSVLSWIGVQVPAGTPKEVIAALQKSLAAVGNDTALVKSLQERGFDVRITGADEFGALIATDTQKWGKVVKANNIRVD